MENQRRIAVPSANRSQGDTYATDSFRAARRGNARPAPTGRHRESARPFSRHSGYRRTLFFGRLAGTIGRLQGSRSSRHAQIGSARGAALKNHLPRQKLSRTCPGGRVRPSSRAAAVLQNPQCPERSFRSRPAAAQFRSGGLGSGVGRGHRPWGKGHRP